MSWGSTNGRVLVHEHHASKTVGACSFPGHGILPRPPPAPRRDLRRTDSTHWPRRSGSGPPPRLGDTGRGLEGERRRRRMFGGDWQETSWGPAPCAHRARGHQDARPFIYKDNAFAPAPDTDYRVVPAVNSPIALRSRPRPPRATGPSSGTGDPPTPTPKSRSLPRASGRLTQGVAAFFIAPALGTVDLDLIAHTRTIVDRTAGERRAGPYRRCYRIEASVDRGPIRKKGPRVGTTTQFAGSLAVHLGADPRRRREPRAARGNSAPDRGY